VLLDSLTRVIPELVGGSADLTPSNNTRAEDQKDVRRGITAEKVAEAARSLL
jgi:transketolase